MGEGLERGIKVRPETRESLREEAQRLYPTLEDIINILRTNGLSTTWGSKPEFLSLCGEAAENTDLAARPLVGTPENGILCVVDRDTLRVSFTGTYESHPLRKKIEPAIRALS